MRENFRLQGDFRLADIMRTQSGGEGMKKIQINVKTVGEKKGVTAHTIGSGWLWWHSELD